MYPVAAKYFMIPSDDKYDAKLKFPNVEKWIKNRFIFGFSLGKPESESIKLNEEEKSVSISESFIR